MAQEHVWEREYRNSKLLTKENKPQNDVVRFFKFLKTVHNLSVLDLGSGTGRNSLYFAEKGAHVTGLEISKTAIDIAKENAKGWKIDYRKQSIGEKFPSPTLRPNTLEVGEPTESVGFEDKSFDVVLDVTSSNSLSEEERSIYLQETHRVLKEGGYFFVKALCKEGDANAKALLKQFPGKEKDTYIMPELDLTERVWSGEDFIKTYQTYFTILKLEKKTSYSRMNNRSYKRNFWIAYMKK